MFDFMTMIWFDLYLYASPDTIAAPKHENQISSNLPIMNASPLSTSRVMCNFAVYYLFNQLLGAQRSESESFAIQQTRQTCQDNSVSFRVGCRKDVLVCWASQRIWVGKSLVRDSRSQKVNQLLMCGGVRKANFHPYGRCFVLCACVQYRIFRSGKGISPKYPVTKHF